MSCRGTIFSSPPGTGVGGSESLPSKRSTNPGEGEGGEGLGRDGGVSVQESYKESNDRFILGLEGGGCRLGGGQGERVSGLARGSKPSHLTTNRNSNHVYVCTYV